MGGCEFYFLLDCYEDGMHMQRLNQWLRLVLAMVLMAVGWAHAATPEYVLGSGDIIRITVYQNPDMTTETRIPEGGSVTFPLLGSVSIGGLSVSAAEKLISEGLVKGNFLKSAQVTILVVQVKGNQVSVLGQVNRPGRYVLEKPDTRLSEVLAQAGGPVAGGAAETVVVLGVRDGKKYRAEIDFSQIFAAEPTAKDLILQNEDTVFVDRAPLIYVNGEVQSPGTKAMQRNMTVQQAIAAAGGLNLRGTLRGLTISRRDATTGEIVKIKPEMTDMLQKDDVIFVQESLF
jgi:polysaccharide biosynthesis/export protein